MSFSVSLPVSTEVNGLPLKLKLIYSMGNMGIGMLTVMHMFYLVYFFFPPKEAGIAYLIPQTSFFIGLTVLGVIMSLSRILDAMLDPVLANFSDRLNHPLGKRIPIMRCAALPFAFFYVLVFFVPISNAVSYYNVVWLFVCLLLSAVAFTSYMIPFYSLMVDLAKSSDDKVDLGTISSALWFIGFLLVSFTPTMWDVVMNLFGVSKIWAIRITFSITACLGFIALMVPALFIDERDFASGAIKKSHKMLPSLKKVMQNRSFRFFLASNASYTIATYIFEAGLIYFITVLAVLDAGLVQGPLTVVIGGLTLACYPLINRLAKSKGKSYVLKISLLLFATTFVVISCFGMTDIHPYILFLLVILFSPFAQASFGILPNVMTSDCAAYDTYKNGDDQAGMYIGINGFCIKCGSSLGMIIFTSLLLFGKDIGDDMGIRLATMVGAVVSLLGVVFLIYYDEKEILTYTK